MAKGILTKKFSFSAGHFLENHPKCGLKHGHNYVLEISIEGKIKENGMVIDFHDLKRIVNDYIIDKLDHQFLNDILPFSPTCENLTVWIWEQLEFPLGFYNTKLHRIRLYETDDSYFDYYGEKN